MPDTRTSFVMLPRLGPSSSAAFLVHAFLAGLFFIVQPAVGFAQEQLRVRAIANYLYIDSKDGIPNVSERDRWKHIATCFQKVTREDSNGEQTPIDWHEQEEFWSLENADSPDHTQRADFMRRVGEVVQRWADRQGTTATYELAESQWKDVLRYTAWEVTNVPQGVPAAPTDPASNAAARTAVVWTEATVTIALRSIRDLASYNQAYCHVCSTNGGPLDSALIAELAANAVAHPENIGISVLTHWRAHLVKHHRCRDAADAVSSSNGAAIEDWKKLLDAADTYLASSEQARLPSQFRSDRRTLPKQS